MVWGSSSIHIQRSRSWVNPRFRANPKSVVMYWPINVTQVYRAQKLDEIFYLKTLSVRGVPVSITKSACFKSVNWQLKIGAISGSRSNCDRSVVAFRLLMQSCWTLLWGPLTARRLMQPPVCQHKFRKWHIFDFREDLNCYFCCRDNLNILLICSISRLSNKTKIPSETNTCPHHCPKCFCSLIHPVYHDVPQSHAIKTFMVQHGSHCISDILNSGRNLQKIIRFQHCGDTMASQAERSAGSTGGWWGGAQTQPLCIAWHRGQGIAGPGCSYQCWRAQSRSLVQASGALCTHPLFCMQVTSMCLPRAIFSFFFRNMCSLSPNQILNIKASLLWILS